MAAKFSGGRFRVSRHGRQRGSRVSTALLYSPRDVKPTGGLAPHYFRRLGLGIAAVYVVLVVGGFAAVGFVMRSAEPGSSAPVHIPRVVFPATSPSVTGTASPHGTGVSAGATARASAAPSVTSPPGVVSVALPVTVSPVAAPSDLTQSAVAVSYLVVAQEGDQFEGEVTVVNNGSAPISGWQIVVALPDDQITSFSNASGYVSDNILVLQPASGADAIAADGTLSVYFTAIGLQTTPEACAFNSVVCG